MLRLPFLKQLARLPSTVGKKYCSSPAMVIAQAPQQFPRGHQIPGERQCAAMSLSTPSLMLLIKRSSSTEFSPVVSSPGAHCSACKCPEEFLRATKRKSSEALQADCSIAKLGDLKISSTEEAPTTAMRAYSMKLSNTTLNPAASNQYASSANAVKTSTWTPTACKRTAQKL